MHPLDSNTKMQKKAVMSSELIFKIFYDLAKNGITVFVDKLNQENFESVLDKTLKYFIIRSYIYSETDLKDFLISEEFRDHLENHVRDRDLDFEYLGRELSKNVILGEGISAEAFLQEFFERFEINLTTVPQLRDQLVLRYLKSAGRDHETQLSMTKEILQKTDDQFQLLNKKLDFLLIIKILRNHYPVTFYAFQIGCLIKMHSKKQDVY